MGVAIVIETCVICTSKRHPEDRSIMRSTVSRWRLVSNAMELYGHYASARCAVYIIILRIPVERSGELRGR